MTLIRAKCLNCKDTLWITIRDSEMGDYWSICYCSRPPRDVCTEFLDELVKSLHIYQFVDWLSKRLGSRK